MSGTSPRPSGGRPEIYAYGLRNPWRFSFDRKTGDLYIGDVGQDTYEEIDRLTASNENRNFGWSIMEGFACYRADNCDKTGLTLPIYAYSHDGTDQSATSVTCYFVVDPTAPPAPVIKLDGNAQQADPDNDQQGAPHLPPGEREPDRGRRQQCPLLGRDRGDEHPGAPTRPLPQGCE